MRGILALSDESPLKIPLSFALPPFTKGEFIRFAACDTVRLIPRRKKASKPLWRKVLIMAYCEVESGTLQEKFRGGSAWLDSISNFLSGNLGSTAVPGYVGTVGGSTQRTGDAAFDRTVLHRLSGISATRDGPFFLTKLG